MIGGGNEAREGREGRVRVNARGVAFLLLYLVIFYVMTPRCTTATMVCAARSDPFVCLSRLDGWNGRKGGLGMPKKKGIRMAAALLRRGGEGAV